MEGKELYNNEDEEFDPKSKKEEQDADEFGLPEIDEPEKKPEDLGDPYPESWEDKTDEGTFAEEEASDDNLSESYDSGTSYSYDDDSTDSQDDEYRSAFYEDEYGQKKSPVGWIIFGVLVLVAIIIAVFWWINREEPEPVQVSQPVIEQPVQKPPVCSLGCPHAAGDGFPHGRRCRSLGQPRPR